MSVSSLIARFEQLQLDPTRRGKIEKLCNFRPNGWVKELTALSPTVNDLTVLKTVEQFRQLIISCANYSQFDTGFVAYEAACSLFPQNNFKPQVDRLLAESTAVTLASLKLPNVKVSYDSNVKIWRDRDDRVLFVVKKLGSGTFGTVYKVLYALDGTQGVIKKPTHKGNGATRAISCLENEFTLLPELHAKGNVWGFQLPPIKRMKLYVQSRKHRGKIKERTCINVPEYAGDFRENVLSTNISPLKDRLIQIHQLFSTLPALEKAAVLHGDIKLDNMLLVKGELLAHLADWGDACKENIPVDNLIQLVSGAGIRAASSQYTSRSDLNASIERAEAGDRAGVIEIEKKRDVFAAGIVAYAAIEREYPHKISFSGGVVGPYREMKRRDVSGALKNLIKRMCVLHYADRPSPQEVFAEYESYLKYEHFSYYLEINELKLKKEYDPDPIDQLITPGITLHKPNGDSNLNQPALFTAAQCGCVNVVKLLLNAKIDPDTRSKNNFSSLYTACETNRLEVIEVLIEAGAKVDSKNGDDGWAPLHIVAERGFVDIVTLLLTNGADPEVCSTNKFYPLFIACIDGRIDVVAVLIKAGAKIDAKNGDQEWTALHKAAQKGIVEVVTLLLTNGAHTDICSRDKFYPLYAACEMGHLDVAAVLIKAGAMVDAKNGDQEWTALHMAAKKGFLHVVTLLLTNGADPEVYSTGKYSPFFLACEMGHLDVADVLIKKGIKVDAKNGEEEWTALHVAAKHGSVRIVTLLRANGADPDVCSKSKFYPLYLACQYGKRWVVEILIQAGVKVNSKNGNEEWTALHVAAAAGLFDIVKLLLQAGADKNAVLRDGRTPLDLAQKIQHKQIIQALS